MFGFKVLIVHRPTFFDPVAGHQEFRRNGSDGCKDRRFSAGSALVTRLEAQRQRHRDELSVS
jgi:hypothetical protein